MFQAVTAGLGAIDPRDNRKSPQIRRFKPRSMSLTRLIVLVAGMITLVDQASSQIAAMPPAIEFDIPSQSLETAIGRYATVTGQDAVYDTSLVAGRQSSPVHGRIAPDQALMNLLSGTGLSAEFVASSTFVILPLPLGEQRQKLARSPEQRRYYGLIQAGITDALCRSQDARPGQYRFTTVVWIGTDGAVRRLHRVGSTGLADADQRIEEALRSVRFDEPPPAGFLQPVLIAIVPKGPSVVGKCED
jgi:hypothetical protein